MTSSNVHKPTMSTITSINLRITMHTKLLAMLSLLGFTQLSHRHHRHCSLQPWHRILCPHNRHYRNPRRRKKPRHHHQHRRTNNGHTTMRHHHIHNHTMTTWVRESHRDEPFSLGESTPKSKPTASATLTPLIALVHAAPGVRKHPLFRLAMNRMGTDLFIVKAQ